LRRDRTLSEECHRRPVDTLGLAELLAVSVAGKIFTHTTLDASRAASRRGLGAVRPSVNGAGAATRKTTRTQSRNRHQLVAAGPRLIPQNSGCRRSPCASGPTSPPLSRNRAKEKFFQGGRPVTPERVANLTQAIKGRARPICGAAGHRGCVTHSDFNCRLYLPWRMR